MTWKIIAVSLITFRYFFRMCKIVRAALFCAHLWNTVWLYECMRMYITVWLWMTLTVAVHYLAKLCMLVSLCIDVCGYIWLLFNCMCLNMTMWLLTVW